MSGYFPDQPIVKGADVIYRPKGNAGEYAPLATNPYVGCGHCCVYCYVPGAMHMKRADFDAGATPRDGYIERLKKDVGRYREAGICDGHEADQIFITFSSDPFHPGNLDRTTETIQILKEGGMAFCTLSKGGSRALDFLPHYRKERDAYAASLTCLDDEKSRKFEKNAALPADRIETLQRFHKAGIFTWVSLEPTLSADDSIEIIRRTHEFVSLYKIGKANYIKLPVDWEQYVARVTHVCRDLGADHYIKRDLQKYLPKGYFNPLRVQQCNIDF